MKFKVIIQKQRKAVYSKLPSSSRMPFTGGDDRKALENIKEVILGCLESLTEERIKESKDMRNAEVIEVSF